MRAPKGYYLPRLAVGTLALIGSVTMTDLIGSFLRPPDPYVWQDDWDGAGAPENHIASTAGTRNVLFVRHAQAAEAGSSAGGASLTDVGRQQAELTARHVAGHFPEVLAVYHSGAPEARRTAEILSGSLAKAQRGQQAILPVSFPLLEEGVPLVPDPVPAHFHAPPEAELAEELARAEEAFYTLIWRPTGEEPGRITTEVVVSHGNIIRYLVCRALQLSPRAWTRLATHNGAVTWLQIESDGRVVLREFGSVGHLPAELVTSC